MNDSITRRTLLGTSLGVATAAALARTGLAHEGHGTPAATPATGEWTWTDARGVTITLPEAPKRVVAMSYAAQSLYDFGVEVVGHYGVDPTVEGREVIGDFDLSTIPYLGPYDAFDIEKFLEIDADLVVDYSWGEGDAATFWFLAGDSRTQVEAIAPVAGISMAGTSVDVSIKQVESLAAALGADVETEAIAASREAYTAASDTLTAAATENPGLKVMALQGDGETLYIANPDYHADLIRFKELGVTFTVFEVDPESDNFWGIYSAEELGTLPTDIFLTLGDLSGLGIWNSLPAVQAGQVGEWIFSRRLSYTGFTANLEAMTELIASSEIVAE